MTKFDNLLDNDSNQLCYPPSIVIGRRRSTRIHCSTSNFDSNSYAKGWGGKIPRSKSFARSNERSKSFTSTEKNKEYSNDIRRGSLPTEEIAACSNNKYFNVGFERRLKRIAISKAKERRWDESTDLFANVLSLQSERLSNDHLELTSTKYQLANSLYHSGLKEQALRLLKEALNVLTAQKINRHALDLASILFLIAIIEDEKGNIDNALYYVKEAQKYEIQALGYKSKKTIAKIDELEHINSFSVRIVKKVAGMAA